MHIRIKLPDGAVPPSNAHASDTGYDLTAASAPVIVGIREGGDLWRRVDYIEYDTGISVAPDGQGEHVHDGVYWHEYPYLLVYPRSSISKTNLILANSVGVVDNAFRGSIKLRFRYLLQPSDLVTVGAHTYMTVDQSRIYQRGDKIGQAVAAWKEDVNWTVVETLDETERSGGGFGSTDKPS